MRIRADLKQDKSMTNMTKSSQNIPAIRFPVEKVGNEKVNELDLSFIKNTEKISNGRIEN